MLGYKQGNLTFDPFDVLIGIGVFATAYLAGITSVSGGILAGMLAAGGIVYYATTQWLDLGDWYGTITGVGLVLTVILNPEGIVGPFHVMLEKVTDAPRRAGRAGAGRQRRVVEARVRGACRSGAAVPARRPRRVRRRRRGRRRELRRRRGQHRRPDRSQRRRARPRCSTPSAASRPHRDRSDSAARSSVVSSPHRRIRAGLGRTFQQIELYDDLSVRENVVGRARGTRPETDIGSRPRARLDVAGAERRRRTSCG